MRALSALAPELVNDFRRDGFVVVPDLLGIDELARFGAAVDEGVARRSRHDTRALAEKTRYEQSFIQCQNLWEDTARRPSVDVPSARHRDGGAPARRRRHPDLARPGAVQGGRRAGHGPAPGSSLLAHRRDGHHHGVDPAGRLDPGQRRHGVPAGEPPARPARVRRHLHRGGRGPPRPPRARGRGAGLGRGAGGLGRLPPRPHLPLGQAEHDGYGPSGAHGHLLRRRGRPGARAATRTPRWSGRGLRWGRSSRAT